MPEAKSKKFLKIAIVLEDEGGDSLASLEREFAITDASQIPAVFEHAGRATALFLEGIEEVAP